MCEFFSPTLKSALLSTLSLQSMPKMPGGDDGEKKEESAESREEAKEQVFDGDDLSKHCIGKSDSDD